MCFTPGCEFARSSSRPSKAPRPSRLASGLHLSCQVAAASGGAAAVGTVSTTRGTTSAPSRPSSSKGRRLVLEANECSMGTLLSWLPPLLGSRSPIRGAGGGRGAPVTDAEIPAVLAGLVHVPGGDRQLDRCTCEAARPGRPGYWS